MFFPSLDCEPNSTFKPSSNSNFFNSFPTPVSYDDSEVENPPPRAHFPPVALAQPLPLWVYSTCEATGDLVGDPRDP